MNDLYEKAFDRIFPGNIGVCEECYGPRYHSTSEKCLSCRTSEKKNLEPIMVEELVQG